MGKTSAIAAIFISSVIIIMLVAPEPTHEINISGEHDFFDDGNYECVFVTKDEPFIQHFTAYSSEIKIGALNNDDFNIAIYVDNLLISNDKINVHERVITNNGEQKVREIVLHYDSYNKKDTYTIHNYDYVITSEKAVIIKYKLSNIMINYDAFYHYYNIIFLFIVLGFCFVIMLHKTIKNDNNS